MMVIQNEGFMEKSKNGFDNITLDEVVKKACEVIL
jgi:hypothetical protein